MTLEKALAAAAAGATILAASATAQALSPAQSGPSFNCARARTFVEKAICNSDALSAKDRRMSRLYFDQLSYYRGYGSRAETRALEESQRVWLAQRNRCQTVGCLHQSYDRRIRQLEAMQ